MSARWILPLSALLASGCTTVTLSKLDHCVVQKTDRLGNTKEEILFCEADPPAWSPDRSVRLAQECLYHDTLSRRDQAVQSQRDGQKSAANVTSGEVFSQCYPEAIRTVQGENEMLKDRASRTDEARARADASHAKLEEGLTKALDRPINAVADAKATSGSDSGSDVKHNAQLTHSDVDLTKPREQITRVEITNPPAPAPRGRRVVKKVASPPAPAAEKSCNVPCSEVPTPSTPPAPATPPSTP